MNFVLLSLALLATQNEGVTPQKITRCQSLQQTSPRTQRFELDVSTHPARFEYVASLHQTKEHSSLTRIGLEGGSSTFLISSAEVKSQGQKHPAHFVDVEASNFEDYRQALEVGSDETNIEKPWRHEKKPALEVRGSAGSYTLKGAFPCRLNRNSVRVEGVLFREVTDEGHVFRLPNVLASGDEQKVQIVVKGAVGQQVFIGGKHKTRARLTMQSSVDVRLKRKAGIQARAAQVVAHVAEPDDTLTLSRVALDVGSLSDRPPPLSFVFVVDRSVSVSQGFLENALLFISNVLDAAPEGSNYSVLTFAREVSVVVDPFSPRDERRELRALVKNTMRANGSHLGRAIEKAKRILSDTGDHEPRLIVMSDGQLSYADRTLKSDAAVSNNISHFIRFGYPDWQRVNSRPFELTGGIALATSLDESVRQEMGQHLVRPVRLEGLRVRSAGFGIDRVMAEVEGELMQLGAADELRELPDFLREHSALTFIEKSKGQALGRGELVATLWSKPVRVLFDESHLYKNAFKGSLAAGNNESGLAEVTLRQFARESGFLSAFSVLEYVPLWRAAPKEALGISASSSGHCGCSGSVGMGHSSRCGIRPRKGAKGKTLVELMQERFHEIYRRCGAVSTEVVVEYGALEIIHVETENNCVKDAYYDWLLERAFERDKDFKLLRSRGSVSFTVDLK